MNRRRRETMHAVISGLLLGLAVSGVLGVCFWMLAQIEKALR